MTKIDYHSRDKLSAEAKNLLEAYLEVEKKKIVSPNPALKVNYTVSSIAFFYEKIRNAVDYKSDHLLRRNAIERILKRLLWERPKAESQEIAGILVRELVWSRYLKDESIFHETIEEIGKVLDRYFEILNFVPSHCPDDSGKKDKLRKEIFGIASAHIEEVLDPSLLHTTVATNAMLTWFNNNLEWVDNLPSGEDKELYLYLAMERSLAKSDDARIRYHLLKGRLGPDKIIDHRNQEQFFTHLSEIDDYLASTTQTRLYRFVKKYAPPFRILKEMVAFDPYYARTLFENEKELGESIIEVYNLHDQIIKRNVRTGILRSIIYIFVTKMLVVFLIEIPYELFWTSRIAFLPLSVNILAPPFFMLLLGASIREPDPRNIKRIIETIGNFVYKTSEKSITSFSLQKHQKRGLVYKTFVLIYGIFFLLILGGLTYLLLLMHFSLPSIVIFFMFLSLVLLFGFRVRASASELNMGEESEGFFSSFFTHLSLPFLDLGVLFSKGLSSFNFLILLMDFLIEAPLKIIIEVAQEWFSFVREKKDEIIEIPSDQ